MAAATKARQLERVGDRRGRRDDGRAQAGARVQGDVLGDVEGLEAAGFRVPGGRDHQVGVVAEETRVVGEPELHLTYVYRPRTIGAVGSRFISAVAFYGPKSGRLRELVTGVQDLIASHVGDDFRPYTHEQVHATLIALNGVRDGTAPWSTSTCSSSPASGGRWTCRG